MIKRILVTTENKFLYVKNLTQDYHTHFGIVSKKDLKKKQGIVTTSKGTTLKIMMPTMADLMRKIKRGAAIILPKDIGYILVETGVHKESKVLEAGAGSAALTIALCNVAKKVYSYDIHEQHYRIAKENLENLGIKNCTLKFKDIKTAKEKNMDLVVLDLPQPWDYDEVVQNALKHGAFLVTYLPTIVQVMRQVQKTSLRHMKTIELIEREWHVDVLGRRVRPKSQMIGHTAFLSIFRKI